MRTSTKLKLESSGNGHLEPEECIFVTKASSSDQEEETGPISIKDLERDWLRSTKAKKERGGGGGGGLLQISQMG